MTDARHDFRQRLVRYVDLGAPGGHRAAADLVRDYAVLPTVRTDAPVEVSIDPYTRGNRHVLALQAELEPLAGDLVGAYIHGSLGSGEEVAYSDLDALVVLGDRAFETPERLADVARALGRARRHMAHHDPLQHHGWFVLTEADLDAYPQGYLPHVVLTHATSLMAGQGECLRLSPRIEPGQARAAFDRLARSVAAPLLAGWRPTHAYAAKAFLSRFMLLPAVYVRARDGGGVWKGDSFAAAAVDVDAATWDAMDRVSAIRRDWEAPIGPALRWLLTQPLGLGDTLRKRLPVPIPVWLDDRLDDDLYSGMVRLVDVLTECLDSADHESPGEHLDMADGSDASALREWPDPQREPGGTRHTSHPESSAQVHL